jgi:O-antigen/teichoic acid export membrane protein
LLREAVPFALAAIIAQVYSYQDAFLIHRFLPVARGGDWARAYKLVYAFQFIPIALGASLYPVMSSLHQTQEVVRVFKKAYEYLLLIASPIMVGIYFVAAPLGARFAPSFVPSAPALMVLVWSLGFGFLWYVHGALLNGFGRQRLQTVVMTCACVCSIVLNIYLIPHFGIVGAATTALISNAVLWAMGYGVISRLVPLPHGALLVQALKIFAAAASMGLVLYALLCYHVTVLLVVPVGGVVYIVGLYVFGGLSRDMRVSILRKIPPRFIFWRSSVV